MLSVEIETKISLALSMDTLVLPIGHDPSKNSPEEECSADGDSFDNSIDDNGENICQCNDECSHFTALEHDPTTCHASRFEDGALEDTEYHNVGDLYMLGCRLKEDGKKFDDGKIINRSPSHIGTNSPSDDSCGLYTL